MVIQKLPTGQPLQSEGVSRSASGKLQFGASKQNKVLRDGEGRSLGMAWSYDDVVLLGGARTPFGKNGGSLSQVGADTLLKTAMQGTLDKVGLSPEQVDNTLVGNIIANDSHGRFMHKQVPNDLGVPYTAIASEVNRLCGTGFELLRTAADYLTDGGDGVILTGGVENMSRIPLIDDQFLPDAMAFGAEAKARLTEAGTAAMAAGAEYFEELGQESTDTKVMVGAVTKRLIKGDFAGARRLIDKSQAALKAKADFEAVQAEMEEKKAATLGNRKVAQRYAENPGMVLNDGLTDTHAGMVMFQTADELAVRKGISRRDADEYSALSQQRATEAWQAGRFNEDVVPVVLEDGTVVDKDEHLRPGTTADKLGKLGVLDTNREDAITTAGSASGVVDGAAALAVSTGKFAAEKHLPVLAKIKSIAVTGCDPKIMGYGPKVAAQEALKAAGLKLDDMDIVEINEAFAAQVLGVAKSLADEEGVDYDELLGKLNPDGGSIALGHPLAASGTRITLHAANQLKEQDKRFALVSACIGGGQGIAVVIENPGSDWTPPADPDGSEEFRRIGPVV